jgi:hypothetical protein
MPPDHNLFHPPADPLESAGPSFYERAFAALELRDLPQALKTGLVDEIAMLRVSMRRVFEASGGEQGPEEARLALGALGLAASRLASLLKTERELTGGNDLVYNAISEALSQVLDEMRADGRMKI